MQGITCSLLGLPLGNALQQRQFVRFGYNVPKLVRVQCSMKASAGYLTVSLIVFLVPVIPNPIVLGENLYPRNFAIIIFLITSKNRLSDASRSEKRQTGSENGPHSLSTGRLLSLIAETIISHIVNALICSYS